MKKLKRHSMKTIHAVTGSEFVRKEVFSRLPTTVPIEFTLEFNDKGKAVIAITSPKYPGILSEARNMEEACEKAHDAILTYFEVPRSCANAIKFSVVDEPVRRVRDGNNKLLRRIEIRQPAHA